jgi:peroxiredoxin Q/BCP
MLEVNKKAPVFTLVGTDGNKYSLKDYDKVVLYFYPKDNTPGCTVQAIDFTDLKDEFSKKGYTIFGVSSQGVESHKKFTDKKDLKIMLLCDEDQKIQNKYGV